MTISTSNRRAGPYLGDGSQREFPFTFKVFAAGDVRAFVADPQGSESELALTAYTVTLHPDQEARPGGLLRLNEALATDHKMTIALMMVILWSVASASFSRSRPPGRASWSGCRVTV